MSWWPKAKKHLAAGALLKERPPRSTIIPPFSSNIKKFESPPTTRVPSIPDIDLARDPTHDSEENSSHADNNHVRCSQDNTRNNDATNDVYLREPGLGFDDPRPDNEQEKRQDQHKNAAFGSTSPTIRCRIA